MDSIHDPMTRQGTHQTIFFGHPQAASSTAASQEVALTTLRQTAREAAAEAATALVLSNQRFEALELAAGQAAAALEQARAEAAQGAAAITALEKRLKKVSSLFSFNSPNALESYRVWTCG